jgi:multidrug resistance efflux pump
MGSAAFLTRERRFFLFTDVPFGVFMLNSLADRTLTLENTSMRSWLDEQFARLVTAFQGFKGRFEKRYEKPVAVAGAGVRASIALGGLLLVVASLGIAMGFSTPGQFRDSIYAMLPASLVGTDQLSRQVVAGVTGYGEIVAARELSLSSQVSGRVTKVLVAPGDTVREGTAILRIDDAEARRVVRDAETEVARAELALARVGTAAPAPAPAPSADALPAALDRAYLQVSDMFPSLPNVLEGLEGMLYGGGFFADPVGTNHLTAQADRANIENPAADSLKLRATEQYENAKSKHNVATARLRSVPGTPDDATLESVLTEANEAVVALSEATKATNDLYIFLKNHLEERGLGTPPVFQEYETALSEYSTQLGDQVGLLAGTVEDVRSARAGTPGTPVADTTLERQEAELELRQAQNALLDARARLALYEVKAPFDGVVASLETKTAQYVADGDTVAKLVANDELASVSLAQGEVARVRIGQEALLSLPGSDIEIRGHVAEIGKGEKGEDGLMYFVVTITIGKDERIRPGMQVVARFLEN